MFVYSNFRRETASCPASSLFTVLTASMLISQQCNASNELHLLCYMILSTCNGVIHVFGPSCKCDDAGTFTRRLKDTRTCQNQFITTVRTSLWTQQLTKRSHVLMESGNFLFLPRLWFCGCYHIYICVCVCVCVAEMITC